MAPKTTGFSVDKWHGEDNYNCDLCQFSTLDPVRMQEHLKIGVHLAAKPTAPKEVKK